MMWKRPPEVKPAKRQTRSLFALAAFVAVLAACATTPPNHPAPADASQSADTAGGPVRLPSEDTQTIIPAPAPRPVAFEDLPGWDRATLDRSIEAFARSCALWNARPGDSPLSSRASYAGTIEDWRPACAALEVATDSESARRVFEALFTPLELLPTSNDAARFTGYFEPQIQARRTPVSPYTQPIPGLPSDLVQVDASRIGGERGRQVPAQRLQNGSLRPYPPRADIAMREAGALGYAHPADVFFLQIQGSGRLTFEDGSAIRAAYAAHNGQPFRSTANHLIRTGKIARGQASMQGIRAWMDRVSAEDAQAAMNANPRFVFFRPLAIGDPGLGPIGAQNVPLTPLGSMAVDTGLHALGVPFFVQTNAPGLGGDWSGLLIAQDTGGAIKGRVRGDIYYGTGDEAGAKAGTQNAPGRMWVFLPRAVAARLTADRPTS